MHPTFVNDTHHDHGVVDSDRSDDVLTALKSSNYVADDDVVKTNGTDPGVRIELEIVEMKESRKMFDEATGKETSERPQWSRQLEFILSAIGYAVGLGNIWRFPYLCYKNGGGAFLVPYVILLICAGIPIFFLEIALGQYMSQGGVGAWNICPIFQGIGVATTVVVTLLNIYYIVVLSWDVYYFYMSLTSVLPWSHCNNDWNTARCRVNFTDCQSGNFTDVDDGNLSSTCLLANGTHFVDPAIEFWERKVLEISSGIDEPGGIVGHLAVTLLIVWVVCYFCIWKGISWTGKVVYFTATFPYIILTILLVRGVTLDGAVDGIVYYLKPDFSKLASSQLCEV